MLTRFKIYMNVQKSHLRCYIKLLYHHVRVIHQYIKEAC